MAAQRTLVVLVPDHWGDPAVLAPLKDALAADTAMSPFQWLSFDYRQPFWSNRSLETVAQNLADSIDSYFHGQADKPERIILVGHSMGSVVLRRALLNASGYGFDKGRTQSWASRVERVILIGAFGRGVDIANLPFASRLYLRPLVALGRLFRFGAMRREILAGSDFISRLRVDWIAFIRSPLPTPVVVHLLGSNDAFVRRKDVIDLEQFPSSIPIGVPDATHADVIVPRPATLGQLKRAFFDEPGARETGAPDSSADKVFFLLHGIRDSRDCFQHVADRLQRLCPGAKIVVPTYGYLSARGFVNPGYRNRFIPWFIDQYSEQLAQNPAAEFYFAGHSNGTYILGESLRRIPRMQFARIYIAASVLPTQYEWDDVVGVQRQTRFVRSDMGTEDWPVGVLCRVLNRLGMRSIGPGGFDGFEFGDKDHIAYNRFAGGHGAMLDEHNVESIAAFLLAGEPAAIGKTPEAANSGLFQLFSKYGDLLLPLILLVLLAGLVLLLIAPWLYPGSGLADSGPWLALALAVIGWFVAGRF